MNVGPTADGRIPVIMQQRLVDIGRWLDVNGEAIFGSSPWRRMPGREWIFTTRKAEDLYIICTRWPRGPVILKGIRGGENTRMSMLGWEGDVPWSNTDEGLVLIPPCITPADLPCQHAWTFKIEGALLID